MRRTPVPACSFGSGITKALAGKPPASMMLSVAGSAKTRSPSSSRPMGSMSPW
jgi:hypothetical protein